MAGLRKVAGAYLMGLAVVVAVYFIINRVLAESFDFDVVTTWYVLDVLMLIGLVLGLVFNYVRQARLKGSCRLRSCHSTVPRSQRALLLNGRRHDPVPS